MRRRVPILLALLVAIALVVGCGAASKVSVKKKTEKAATEARVEVLESKMEKTEGGNWVHGYGTVKVTGTAKYIPAKAGAKPFNDLSGAFVFDLLDAAGKKVRKLESPGDCGRYGKSENVVPNEPFPFVIEDGMVPKDQWAAITSHRFLKWWYVK